MFESVRRNVEVVAVQVPEPSDLVLHFKLNMYVPTSSVVSVILVVEVPLLVTTLYCPVPVFDRPFTLFNQLPGIAVFGGVIVPTQVDVA